MTCTSVLRARFSVVALGLMTATLVTGLISLPALASSPTKAAATSSPSTDDAAGKLGSIGDAVAGIANVDLRGRVLPSAAQRRAAASLGAVDLRWNQYGTPTSILPADGVLAKATSKDPVVAARAWLSNNAAVFGLTRAQVARLQLVSSQPFALSSARAVLFRQRFGALTPALGSLVTVGVANREIAYVSSSIARTGATPAAAKLSPLKGWLAAAKSVGLAPGLAEIAAITSKVSGGWTRLTVPGFAQEQQVRLRALALAKGGVRPVLEANVVNVAGGSATAYTVLVDAVTGKVLYRENKVENNNAVYPFNGSITAVTCGPMHPFELTDNNTKTIVATAAMANTLNDIEVKIFSPSNALLVTGDTGTSPESATYSAASIPAGIYKMQVCPFAAPTIPFLPPGNYAAAVVTSDVGAPGTSALQSKPRWRYFPTNPALNWSAGHTPTNHAVGCWVKTFGCTLSSGSLNNVQAPGPWDSLTLTGSSSLTTVGNNANTHEAWVSPLTPGGTAQAPISATRDYTTGFSDAWNNSKCNPTQLHPGGNDINFSVTNLFASHNRMHDFAYYLGFNERNYNLQLDNLARGGVDGDPEIGNVQAGALTGGQPSFLGRDNANQITLQDGVPGITNQYLFQSLAGAFYAPCADGGLDMSIVGHEYTHAISNRMVAGPDEGLTSEQGGAMGESWGDLVGAEYIFSHNYSNGASPWSVGPYATGNKAKGIRDFAINKNPLNYADYGFDSTGVEVHADGEIWNGTQWEVRQALVKKWNKVKRFHYNKKPLQLKCAQGERNKGIERPQKCPGNRRWLQLMFDAFLLQQGATSMLDARDAMIAADQLRFRGENANVLWGAFARRGMGKGARTPNADSGDVKPSYASRFGKNTKVTFKGKGNGEVYVGMFEARATPIADLKKKTKLGKSARFTPGKYKMLYVSKSHGFKRFTLKVTGQKRKTVKLKPQKNWAAKASGARVIRSTAGSRNPNFLIDGTEATNWGGVTAANVDASKPFVAVDLGGGKRTIKRVQVSAMLTPAIASDADSGSRFTALRRFAIETCTANCGSSGAKWKRIYTSSASAFPSVIPRPVAPDLVMRSFKVPKTKAAAVRLVVLENQCTGTPGYAGEQDNDPINDTDCKSATDRGTIVHASELQVFSR